MKKNKQLSFCVAVYNEEEIIEEAIREIDKKLLNIFGKNNYEIIIVNNGSTDKTWNILKKLRSKTVKPFSILEKAHGLALKTAIEKAKSDRIEITGIDIPFGFDDLKKAIRIWDNGKADIIFGSKSHSKSVINRSLKRKASTIVYDLLLNFLFDLKIKDTQGSVFLNKHQVMTYLNYCNSKDAFFTSQLAIYAKIKKLKMIEIPIKMKDRKRKSKYSIFRDGKKMLNSMLTTYIEIKRKKFIKEAYLSR